MLTVVTFLWVDTASRKPYTYSDKYVLTLKKQVDKYLTIPHEFVCVTDTPTDAMKDAHIRCIKLDKTTFKPNSRYVKLQMFSDEFAQQVPGKILYLDLDSVIVGNIDDVVNREEDIVLWRNPNYTVDNKRAFYNTSIILHKTGTCTYLYDNFEKVYNSEEYRNNLKGATDQKYLSYVLGNNMPYWKGNDLIWGAGRLKDDDPTIATTKIPNNARIIFFPGNRVQFDKTTQTRHPWLKQYIL